ncbi:hypothetical protein EMB92_07100 [Bifidobacterium callitrichos]|uniref:Histidine kinase n=1 Tax=Bifidobacterium callitrichos TaxID=762209 RepID=A0A5M9ZD58_9BIFI|nr:hypothetical protein [Bifidobacterium callitrichos]KAA8816630.1 hypothetical protein EMB92_07100 [Bifidobacterium callitrichos]
MYRRYIQPLLNGIQTFARTAFARTFPSIARQAVAIIAGLFATTVLANELLAITQPQMAYHGHVVMTMIELVLCVVLALWPRSGSWLMLLLYLTEQWMPFPAIPTMTAIPSFILPIIGYYSLPMGIFAALLTALGNHGVTLAVVLGANISPALPLIPSTASNVSIRELALNITINCFQLVPFAVAGRIMRWATQQIINRSVLLQRMEREQTAMTIHNDICNALSYLQLRVDQKMIDGTVSQDTDHERDYAEFRGVLETTLRQAHHVIAVLEQQDHNSNSADISLEDRACTFFNASDSAGDSIAATSNVHDAMEQYQSIVRSEEDKLHHLGFQGMTILPTDASTHLPLKLTPATTAITTELLMELYGNIQKHADPAFPYCITIGIQADAISIDASNTPNLNDHHSSMGTGLTRFRKTLERDGGTLTISATDDIWTISARIPLTMTARIEGINGINTSMYEYRRQSNDRER